MCLRLNGMLVSSQVSVQGSIRLSGSPLTGDAGMGVSYNEFPTPLISGEEQGIWRPGDRCPDMVLATGSDETRLYSSVSYGKFLVLSIGQHLKDAPGNDQVSVFTVLPQGVTNGHHELAKGEIVFSADWADASNPLVVVVRPDMYIGYVSQSVDDDGWRAYLNNILAQS